jgi:putative ABC transport system permease protein
MLANTFRLALRHLARHKTFSLINIGGLAISLASCIFIFYFVYDEFTYDRFHENSARIYRLTQVFKTPEDTQNLLWTHQKIGPHMKRVYPQVEEFVRFEDAEAIFGKVNKEKIVKVDPSVFNVFTYPLIEGNPNTALKDLHSIVISEALSKKYFHGVAMGQVVEIDNEPYSVTGIMRDVPSNSDKWINAMAHGEFGGEEDADLAFGYQTYILLKDKDDASFIREKLATASDALSGTLKRKMGGQLQFGFDMQSLTDLHFFTGTGMDNPKGNEANTKILAIVAIVLLLVALFNFINLTTVISLERAKEVGVRKVAGAQRGELVRQFLGESGVAVAIAAALALFIAFSMRSIFTSVSGKEISFNNENDLWVIGASMLLLMLAAIVSSFYPASILSSYKPVKALRNQKEVYSGGNIIRKILVSVQFGLSTALLIFLATVLVQTDFMRSTDTGFNKEKILVLDMPGDSASRAHTNYYVEEFRKINSVSDVAIGGFGSTPGTTDVQASPVTIMVDGEKREPVVANFSADTHYTSMLELNAIEGKSLHDLDEREVGGKAVINESFAKSSGWKNPIGNSIHTYAGDYEIVGIISDFHFKSLHNKIEPMIIAGQSREKADASHLFIKTSSNNIDELRTTWQRILPGQPFEHHFLNDYFDQQYKAETTLQTIFIYFTLLTIVIAGSGLFGLTIHHVEKKTKEISIRKVLGASVMSIIRLLSKEFMLLTVGGVIVGSIAGSTLASEWLAGFAYHIEPGIKTFAAPVLIMMLLAGIILAYKTYQGSNRNPVQGLKHE